jgi:hypothetical protein
VFGYNFIWHKKALAENGWFNQSVSYYKLILGAACFWQFNYFDFMKYNAWGNPHLYWSILLMAKIFMNVPLKYPNFNLDRSIYLFLGF